MCLKAIEGYWNMYLKEKRKIEGQNNLQKRFYRSFLKSISKWPQDSLFFADQSNSRFEGLWLNHMTIPKLKFEKPF